MPTLKSGWQMPPPPVEGAVPAFYNDSGSIWLHWVHGPAEGPDDEFLPVEVEDMDIGWPFEENHATHADLEKLGFVNVDP